jgi:nitrite reductase (NO-forming)
MMKAMASNTSNGTNLARHIVALRTLFGVIWAIDAVMKWLPGFRRNLMMDVMSAGQGQPHWLAWWFDFWMKPMMHHGNLFAYFIAVAESLIALAVLLGFARKLSYIFGAVFSLLIWGVGEGFGGPYMSGATDIGSAIMYAVVFYALYQLERAATNAWSLDNTLAKKIVWWQRIAQP